ncbi:MAG: CCA tRNA nucleotidyltransferase [Candidatus Acidiferrales bacterium]|jgi:poly(A) polymerase
MAYLVGGCVRDILLKREPEDYDITTDATPDEVEALFPFTIDVGARFGVMIVMEDRSDPDAAQVEVATFRSDTSYSDGRHPDAVVYSKTPQEDVARRDFTINALLLDPANGEVLDFVGGRDDLRDGIIRAIGEPERRFEEDKLRMLRAVRFAARFGYAIEPRTFSAIKKLAPGIHQVSAERVRDELTKILTEGHARRGFELLDETGLLVEVLPEIAKMKGVEQPAQFHPEGDVWTHTLMMLDGLQAGVPSTLAWGVLLHDVGKPPTFAPPSGPNGRIRFDRHVEVGVKMAEEIGRRFRFSNEDVDQISALVMNHMRFKDVPLMKPATLKRFARLDRFDEHLELHRLDCLSSHRNLHNYDAMMTFLAETPPEQVAPDRFLTGKDLIEMGFRPGPRFKEILNAAEDAQLNGAIQDREAAQRFVVEHYGPPTNEGMPSK